MFVFVPIQHKFYHLYPYYLFLILMDHSGAFPPPTPHIPIQGMNLQNLFLPFMTLYSLGFAYTPVLIRCLTKTYGAFQGIIENNLVKKPLKRMGEKDNESYLSPILPTSS